MRQMRNNGNNGNNQLCAEDVNNEQQCQHRWSALLSVPFLMYYIMSLSIVYIYGFMVGLD
jgi:nitrate reductase NapE component